MKGLTTNNGNSHRGFCVELCKNFDEFYCLVLSLKNRYELYNYIWYNCLTYKDIEINIIRKDIFE